MKKLICILPWLLLIITIWVAFLKPSSGLIGNVSIPEDDAYIAEESVQWWYWTGHLYTESGREFGFEVCIFAFKALNSQLHQIAITDVVKDTFLFGENIVLGLPNKELNEFTLSSGSTEKKPIVFANGGNGNDQLKGVVDNYSFDFKAIEQKKPVLHYDGAAHPFVYGGYTYYYSREHMKTSGTITIGDSTYNVTGTTWFDRQYGDLYQSIIKGWQWFAIELDDNIQIMVYDFLGKYSDVERYASITDKDGNTKDYGPKEFTVEELGSWKSPNTGCQYSSGWQIEIDTFNLIIEPLVKDQELRAEHDYWAGPEYWEGTASVKGTNKGRAYVELNGFCRSVEGTLN